jgi:hypothetical protein
MRCAETLVLGEYVAATGQERRIVAVERGGGWCLLDVPASPVTTAGFQVVRRLGDPNAFDRVAKSWMDRAKVSPLGPRWLAVTLTSEAQSGSLAIDATVDLYNDRRGMRRVVLVKDPVDAGASHLLDVAVDPDGAPARLVAPDIVGVDEARDFAVVHVEGTLLRHAAAQVMRGT